jgi:hypothetical protein
MALPKIDYRQLCVITGAKQTEISRMDNVPEPLSSGMPRKD